MVREAFTFEERIRRFLRLAERAEQAGDGALAYTYRRMARDLEPPARVDPQPV